MSKCNICNKKLNNVYLSLYTCKCANVYCGIHKNNHDCNFDYKLAEKKRLKNKLIKIVSSKVEKI